jgi:hypothetical protein
MRGSAVVTGKARTEADGLVVVPAPVTVALVDGVLEVDLPPDTYHVSAALRSVDGDRLEDSTTVVLEAAD